MLPKRTRHATDKPTLITIAALALTALVTLVLAVGCQSSKKAQAPTVYRADIHALNAGLTGLEPSGTATVTVTADSVRLQLDVEHVSPNVVHMIHIHGFASDKQATCPSDLQDTNHDSIIDDPEAEATAGVPLIPFNDNPAGVNASNMTYPVADSAGRITYDKTIALANLKKALASSHQVTKLDFGKCIIMVHGMAAEKPLPTTVMSPAGTPAAATVPVACGEFKKVTPPTQ